MSRKPREDIRDLVKLSPEDEDLRGYRMTLHMQYADLTTDKFGYKAVHQIVGERIGLKSSRRTPMDHINRDKLDNRRENLRVIKARDNQLNSERLDNAVGVTQVKNGKWVAQITIDGVTTRLGTFSTREDAVNQYQLSRNAGRPLKILPTYRGAVKRPNGKWMAVATIDGKSRSLGSFATEQEAIDAYRSYRLDNPSYPQATQFTTT